MTTRSLLLSLLHLRYSHVYSHVRSANIIKGGEPSSTFSLRLAILRYSHPRCISSTPHVRSAGWIKGGEPSYSLTNFVEKMQRAKSMAFIEQRYSHSRCISFRSSFSLTNQMEKAMSIWMVNVSESFNMQSAFLRYLTSVDPTGEAAHDAFVETSEALNTVSAVRLLGSGPRCGLGKLILIMPVPYNCQKRWKSTCRYPVEETNSGTIWHEIKKMFRPRLILSVVYDLGLVFFALFLGSLGEPAWLGNVKEKLKIIEERSEDLLSKLEKLEELKEPESLEELKQPPESS